MKKKQIYFSSGGGKLRKMTLIMKMTVIFLLCANLVMATESFGQGKVFFFFESGDTGGSLESNIAEFRILYRLYGKRYP